MAAYWARRLLCVVAHNLGPCGRYSNAPTLQMTPTTTLTPETEEGGRLSQVQAHADRHAVTHILAPIEQAIGLGRQSPGAQRGESLAQIMGPLEDMLSRMGSTAKPSKHTSPGKDPEAGTPLVERVDKVVAECSARQATISQLQLDLTRCATLPACVASHPGVACPLALGRLHAAGVPAACCASVSIHQSDSHEMSCPPVQLSCQLHDRAGHPLESHCGGQTDIQQADGTHSTTK